MNTREKKLAAGVAAVVALWGGNQGWEKYQTALKRNQNQQQSVAQELSETRLATARGRRAEQKLKQWQNQSLPTEQDIAKSLYQDWLQQQLTGAGLKIKSLTPSQQFTSNSAQQFSYLVAAEGKLEQFVDFLYQFYRAPHLHRISKVDLRPTTDRQGLTMSLTVEALSLPDADREDQLAEGTKEEITESLEEFRKNIVGRNLFTTYQPAQAESVANQAATPDTELAQAKFTGLHYGDAGWQMTVRMQDSGKVYYFHEGDPIQIGRFEGTVEQIDGDEKLVVVSTESRPIRVRFGQTLAEAQAQGRSRGGGPGRMRRGRFQETF